MRNLLQPKWLLLINTLPIAVMVFLFYGEYSIIKSLLQPEVLQQWKKFATAILAVGVINLAYTVYLIVKRQQVSLLYAILALLCYIPLMYLFCINYDQLVPFSIPRWMVSQNGIEYVFTFLMPTLAYALFVLVVHFTPDIASTKPWKNMLIAILVPLAWYTFFQVLQSFSRGLDSNFAMHTTFICFIIGTLIFLFFLIRFFYILASEKRAIWQRYQLAWKIPVAIVFPLLGLAINNGHIGGSYSVGGSGIFGDFSSPWFYILALCTGILVCLPNIENKIYRLILFAGRSITLAYTFYFFLVFLPFLPLSIVAIVALGAGFLMLTPLVLFVLHINELSKDFAYLKSNFPRNILWSIALIGFLSIPAWICFIYQQDRKTLNAALDYLYNPDYSKTYQLDKTSLLKTLNAVKEHKERRRDFIFENKQPYLSGLYNWIVLDNLTLSDAKTNLIERVFYGNPSFKLQPQTPVRTDSVSISSILTKSVYDSAQNAWLSWVDLELTSNDDNSTAEYVSSIQLPEGAWISDYYLYIGDRKEPGILAEKKSAMWLYNNITTVQKDPGILYYITGNKVALRVFPFVKDEVRKTGLQILHKEPIDFTIDHQTVRLGNEAETINKNADSNSHVAYISTAQKQSLPAVHRKPYFHFLVDISKGKENYQQNFGSTIDKLMNDYKALGINATISFVNSDVSSISVNAGWKDHYRKQHFEDGFFLDRGIRKTLVNAYEAHSDSYPVMVVLTDSSNEAILDKDFTDLKMTFPESDLFYFVGDDEKLKAHSLSKDPIKAITDSNGISFDHTVLVYTAGTKKYYLPNNQQSSIVLKDEIFEVDANSIKEKNWQSALTMQGKWQSQILLPETSNQEWLNLVKYSFKSKVMTPVTSYLALENDAQKALLKRKQEQVLSGNKSLDPGEDSQRMSEPGLLLLAALLGIFWWWKERRKRSLIV